MADKKTTEEPEETEDTTTDDAREEVFARFGDLIDEKLEAFAKKHTPKRRTNPTGEAPPSLMETLFGKL